MFHCVCVRQNRRYRIGAYGVFRMRGSRPGPEVRTRTAIRIFYQTFFLFPLDRTYRARYTCTWCTLFGIRYSLSFSKPTTSTWELVLFSPQRHVQILQNAIDKRYTNKSNNDFEHDNGLCWNLNSTSECIVEKRSEINSIAYFSLLRFLQNITTVLIFRNVEIK